MSDELRNLVEILEADGHEVVVLGHPPGTCNRCGHPVKETAFGCCFVCAMWEDPESSDKELRRGALAALDEGVTLPAWLAGRKAFGSLVPPDALRTRIQVQVERVISDLVMPWVDAHRAPADGSGPSRGRRQSQRSESAAPVSPLPREGA